MDINDMRIQWIDRHRSFCILFMNLTHGLSQSEFISPSSKSIYANLEKFIAVFV